MDDPEEPQSWHRAQGAQLMIGALLVLGVVVGGLVLMYFGFHQ